MLVTIDTNRKLTTFYVQIRISYNLSSESPIKRTEMQEDFELKCVFAKYNLTPVRLKKEEVER